MCGDGAPFLKKKKNQKKEHRRNVLAPLLKDDEPSFFFRPLDSVPQVVEYFDRAIAITAAVKERTKKLADFKSFLEGDVQVRADMAALKSEVNQFALQFPMPGFDDHWIRERNRFLFFFFFQSVLSSLSVFPRRYFGCYHPAICGGASASSS